MAARPAIGSAATTMPFARHRMHGTLVARTDSVFYSAAFTGAVRAAGAFFSVTVRMDPKVRAAIAAVPEQPGQRSAIPQAHKQQLRLVGRFGRDETMIGYSGPLRLGWAGLATAQLLQGPTPPVARRQQIKGPASTFDDLTASRDSRHASLTSAQPGLRVRFAAVAEPDFLRATRAAYDAVATDYAARFRDELAGRPLDRAMLAGFAELVRAAGAGPVADVGCGTGRVTALLSSLGVSVFGVDLSQQMVAVARRSQPELRFDVGSMLGLDLPDGCLGGVMAWYSIIHIPDDRLPTVFAEFCRVLAPRGLALLAFQSGDDTLHLTEALGHAVSLDFRRRRPEHIAALLNQAGLLVQARLLREPDNDGRFPERTPQAFLLARKPGRGAARSPAGLPCSPPGHSAFAHVSSVDEEGQVPEEADHESVVRLYVEPVKPGPVRSDRVLLEPG
jgi:SAM-dependent methyltransferase